MTMKNILKLIRIQQWYKNLVVFLAIFFSGNIQEIQFIFPSVIAFFSLSLISSASYIINDLADLKKDRLHPEKKNRPIAAGKISFIKATTICILLLTLSIYLAYTLNIQTFYLILSLFSITQIYTFILKKVLIADILTIASLFVLRAIIGATAISVIISPWLILVPFFLSLFLSIGKRHNELYLLKEKAAETRKVLKEYTHELTNPLMVVSTTLLIISYALYSFLSKYNYLLHTLPFAIFTIFRYYYLIISNSSIARKPERIINDKPMVIGIVIWLILTLFLIYT